MSIPRSTHSWLKPLYDDLEQRNTKRPLQLGSTTGFLGFFGSSGVTLPLGVGDTGGVTGASTFATARTNGGVGANYYTFSDLVKDLKALGLIAT